MKTVSTEYEYIVDNDDDEIDIEIDYRCFFAPNMALYPMTVMRSIYNGCSLQEAIHESKGSYEKDYIKVEVVNVRINI